jgi:hypothetical protein
MDHTSITSDAAELRDLVSPKRYLINKALRILGQKESEEKQLLDYKIFSKQNGCPKTCRDILLWPFRCMAIFPHSTGYPEVHHLIHSRFWIFTRIIAILDPQCTKRPIAKVECCSKEQPAPSQQDLRFSQTNCVTHRKHPVEYLY